MNKKAFIPAELDVIKVSMADIIATSPEGQVLCTSEETCIDEDGFAKETDFEF